MSPLPPLVHIPHGRVEAVDVSDAIGGFLSFDEMWPLAFFDGAAAPIPATDSFLPFANNPDFDCFAFSASVIFGDVAEGNNDSGGNSIDVCCDGRGEDDRLCSLVIVVVPEAMIKL